MFISLRNETLINDLIRVTGMDKDRLHAACFSGAKYRNDEAVNFLKFNGNAGHLDALYIGTSGGKDSVVIRHLARQAFDRWLPIVHTPKPGVTHLETVKFLYEMDEPIIYCPARYHHTLGLKTQIDGTRRSEFSRTDGRSTDVVIDGQNVSRENMPRVIRNGLFGLNFMFPILEWSDEEVWAHIILNEIHFTCEYFDMHPVL